MEATPTAEYKEIRIAVPWGHIDGRWYGNRKVRPILALHGWLDNIGTFETLIPLLPKHVGILSVDFPGHGLSSKYPKGISYHAFDYVDIIKRVMNEYRWNKVSLMGHSMGAIVCFIYTSIFPQTVDLYITIDLIKPAQRPLEFNIKSLNFSNDKMLIEDERLGKLALQEPPSYTYDELKRLLYEGSSGSVDMENCKYILNRSITKSTKYPDKYFFSRDGKIKYYREFLPEPGLINEMAKRIENVPMIAVKGSQSPLINKDSNDVIAILHQKNPHFQIHEVDGTHYVHLNNPKDTAAVLSPFINKYRPMTLDSWTMSDDENGEATHKNQSSSDEGTRSTMGIVKRIFRSKL